MRIGFIFTLLMGATVAYLAIDRMAMAAPQNIEERKVLPMDVSFEKSQAYSTLNTIREALHLTRLSPNSVLSEAAQAHADYLVANKETSHYETEGKAYFTGKAPLDRAFHAGYNASQVSENLSTHNADAQSSIDGLFAAIYHRFGFLSPSIDEVGIGTTQDKTDSKNSAFVYVMGNSEFNRVCSFETFRGSGSYNYGICREKAHKIDPKVYKEVLDVNKIQNPKIIVYPYDGQKEVPLAFYNESPDPLPDYDVSGFPISVEFNDHFIKKVKIKDFMLLNENRELVKTRSMDKQSDPHIRFTETQFALFPLERLSYDTTYFVEFTYRDGSGDKKISWSFHTKKPREKLHIIRKKEESITIETGKSHLIYFKPLNPHDIVKNVSFPASLDVQFIDNNTLKITVMNEDLESFDIESETRTLHVKVNSQ